MSSCLKVLAFASVFWIGHGSSLDYTITTEWNGVSIDRLGLSTTNGEYPAKVNLTNDNGQLRITVSAKFFNSPSFSVEPIADECPQRSLLGLWNYEVVEAFFLNDNNEYLEIEFSPTGPYIALILSDERKDELHSLQLDVQVNNPCESEKNCYQPWTATAIIPKEYLPSNVTKFNAYAIHGRNPGEASPGPDLVYESLYPADPEVQKKPDFHYLDGFKAIDLSSIGISTDFKSDLWEEATSDSKNYEITYNFTRQNDCSKLPEDYEGGVTLIRDNQNDAVKVLINVSDAEFRAVEPCSLSDPGANADLTTDTETVWIQFTNDNDEYLRFGVNPQGAYKIEMNGKESIETELKTVQCDTLDEKTEDKQTSWSCIIILPRNLFPNDVNHFQAVHFHDKLLNNRDREIITAICPGIKAGDEIVDWKGCQIDRRSILADNPEKDTEEDEKNRDKRDLEEDEEQEEEEEDDEEDNA